MKTAYKIYGHSYGPGGDIINIVAPSGKTVCLQITEAGLYGLTNLSIDYRSGALLWEGEIPGAGEVGKAA